MFVGGRTYKEPGDSSDEEVVWEERGESIRMTQIKKQEVMVMQGVAVAVVEGGEGSLGLQRGEQEEKQEQNEQNEQEKQEEQEVKKGHEEQEEQEEAKDEKETKAMQHKQDEKTGDEERQKKVEILEVWRGLVEQPGEGHMGEGHMDSFSMFETDNVCDKIK